MRAAAFAALAAAAALAGCGGGGGDRSAGPRSTIARYFAAVAASQADAACAQLTEASQERLAEFARPLHQKGTGCPATMQAVFSSPYGHRLATLRRPHITRLDVSDGHATARVDGVDSPLTLQREDGAWRIEFTPSVEADKLPGGPKDSDKGDHDRDADSRGDPDAGGG